MNFSMINLLKKKYFVLVLVLVLFSCTDEKNKPLNNMAAGHGLQFSALAQTWDEAIPLGNGELGALVWQKNGNLRLSLDRSDLWDLRPIESLSKPEFSYSWVYEQVLKGDYTPVQQLFDVPYNQLPGPSKIPGAALEFDIAGLGAVKNVQLKTDEAICIVEWESGAILETFVQADSPAGWFLFKNVTEGFTPNLIPPEYKKKDTGKQEDLISGQDLQRLGYTQGETIKDGNKLLYRQEGWGGFEYEVAVAWKNSGNNSIQGCWNISSTFSENKTGKRAGQVVSESLIKGLNKSLESQRTWWNDFWAKSAVSLPDSILENQWYMEQYKFGSAARANTPPISLQAVWTADHGKLPPWKGDFHHDLNTQLSYWPAYSGNHLDLEARNWFQDVKFGLFVHWGVYSVHGRGEWVMNQEKINITDYEKLPPQFNPVRFDPDEWCSMAKNAGMKYITITSKHHDGFAMWDSKVSDYDIVDKTPYKKDVLKMLSDACERHGLKLFFYHSQLDWHHPDYYPRGRTGKDYTGREKSGNWNAYLDYMDAQLSELCSNYGKIGGIWFDGMWDKPDVDWRLGKTYSMIHNIRSDIMIGSNHHVAPFPGEDFQMFEKGLPGKDPFSKKGHVSVLPLETCETINKSWGYNKNDKELKSTKELVQYLAKAAGNNANFLLNVGPMPDGTIQPEFRKRLAEMGNWVRANGESVYNTRGGPVPPQDWGVTTHRGKNTVYLHLLSETIDRITVPDMGSKVKYARLLNGTAVEFEEASSGTVFRIPEDFRDPYDTVIVVTIGE